MSSSKRRRITRATTSSSTTGRRRRGGASSSSSSFSAAVSPSIISTASVVKDSEHASNLLARLECMRRDGELIDLVIRPDPGGCGVGDGSSSSKATDGIQAHAVVMAAASPFIHSRVTRWHHDGARAADTEDTNKGGDEDEGGDECKGEARGGKSGKAKNKAKTPAVDGDKSKGETAITTITIPNLDESVLRSVVAYAYTGTLTLDTARKDSALKLLAGLQLLDMVGAQATVVGWLVEHLEPSSVLGVKRMAEVYHVAELADEAVKYVDANFTAVSAEEEWGELGAEDVESIVTRDELRPSGEMNVFRALVRWARAGVGAGSAGSVSREAAFVGLLCRCLRTPLMSTEELTMEVTAEALVVQSGEAMTAMLRVVRERAAGVAIRAQYASPAALCRRRADGTVTKLAVVGGDVVSSVRSLDPSSGEWGELATMSTARSSHGVGVVGGKLYAVGGSDAGGSLSSVECFDPATGQWSAVASMGTARSFHGVGVVGGKLYAVGGWDGSSRLSSMECFDPATGQWSAVASMGTARFNHGVGVVGGKLYAVGGYDGSIRLSSVECFDPATGQWSAVASMGTARCAHGVGVVGGKLYAVGGYDGSSQLSSVECFDPATGQWSAVAPVATPLSDFHVAALELPRT